MRASRWMMRPGASRGLAALALAAALAAVAPGSTSAREGEGEAGAKAAEPSSEEAALRERVQDYWKAKIARSAEVYSFYPPTERSDPEKLARIAELGNIHYSSFEIDSIELEDGDAALVRGTARIGKLGGEVPAHAARAIKKEPHSVDARWKKVDGTWYREPVPRRSLTQALGAANGGAGASGGGEEPKD